MPFPPIKTADTLRWRCRVMATVLFCFFMLITFALWFTSIDFMDFRIKSASVQNAGQSIEHFITLFEDRLNALHNVAHLYENIPDMSETQFQGFCASVLQDVPGIRAILLADTAGRPTWIAPREAQSLGAMTSDPKLETALSESYKTREAAITGEIFSPEIGTGFLAASPVLVGTSHRGYVIGIFKYQELLSHLLDPNLIARYAISISHGGKPIFASTGSQPGQRATGARAYGQQRFVVLGGQEWTISMAPITSPAASPANAVSLMILGLGLCLSVLLTWLAYRWQLRSMLLQAQARDSQSRLERTGLSLAEVRTEMDLILNSVDEGIIFYNAQLEPVQANAAFLAAFNLTEDHPAMRAGHAHHEHMIQIAGSETKYWSLFNALRSNPEQSYTDELEVRPRTGAKNYRALLRRATVAGAPGGGPGGVLVIYKDLTKIKMIDRVKDEFLSNVTHELRSPLASIKGFAETIQRDPNMAGETRAEFVRIICDEAARLQKLIDELLDLRRMEAQGIPFTPAPYDIRQLVDEIIKGARSILLAKNLTIKMQWDGLFGSTLKGDVTQLSRALRNLLVNAVKYSPQGGEIAITGHCGQYRVWLEVADQGTGIDEKDLPHIFDKFYRGTRQGYQKGTGLGLAIVKNIIEMHGGHLGVRSEVGMGTTFRMDLPRQYSLTNQPGTAAAIAEKKKEEIPAETPLEAMNELEKK